MYRKFYVIFAISSIVSVSFTGEEKKKLQKELKKSATHTHWCAFFLLVAENLHSHNDSARTTSSIDKMERYARESFKNASQSELAIRDDLRGKWHIYDELDAMPKRTPAKL
jgi:hypothetical protein